MPLPDPYADEATVQVTPSLYLSWRNAQDAADAAQKLADVYKEQLMKEVGDSHAGMVGDQKVVSYRPTTRYAESRLCKENPELTQHFYHEETREVFSMDDFRRRHPDVAEKYRVRQFRMAE